jgi:hypothetical protein
MKKHFDNLGLPPTASQADVKRAYRKLAMKLHPDKNPHPQAAALFTELQESYDLLMDYLNPNRSQSTTTKSTLRKEKTKEDRVKEARKRYENQKRREQQANEKYFRKLTSGRKWKVYKVGSVICAILFFLLALEMILPNIHEKDQFTGWSHKEKGGISLSFVHPISLENNGIHYIEKGLFHDFKYYPNTYVIKSRIFHLPLKIVHPVNDEIKTYHLDWCFSTLMPFALLFFAFPSLLFIYRKKSPNFVFAYQLSFYFIFPLTVYFLISDNRWLHLITLGWI